MISSYDAATGETVIRATAREVACMIAWLAADPRAGLTDEATQGRNLTQSLHGKLGTGRLRFELGAPDMEETQSPVDDCHNWAFRKAQESHWTYSQLLELRKAANTDARAEYLFKMENATCCGWANFLDAIKSIPSENPPGVSPPPAIEKTFPRIPRR